ncbi:MAG TPA: porin family protein [Cyclobacteriaceae bacterium]|nr:porin family protein [Cyclobacteriaceae bacterium]
MTKIKILLFSFVLISAGYSASGQAQVAIGIKGGINLSNLDGVNSVGVAYDKRTGYHLGAYALFKFTKIGIQPEILFSQQGQNFTFNGQNLSSNYNYVTVPVMLKLYLIAGLNLQAGVQVGFLSSSSGDVYNTATSSIQTGQSMDSFVHSVDWSAPVGIGFDLPFGLNLTARYNIGISEVNKAAGSTVPPAIVTSMGTSSAKNQVFQFSVGFRLFKFGN